jgi:hypothetical protein
VSPLYAARRSRIAKIAQPISATPTTHPAAPSTPSSGDYRDDGGKEAKQGGH